jgi:Trypsin
LEGALTKKETHFDFFEFSLIQFLLGMNAGGHRVGGWSRRQWLTINSNRNTEMVLLWHLLCLIATLVGVVQLAHGDSHHRNATADRQTTTTTITSRMLEVPRNIFHNLVTPSNNEKLAVLPADNAPLDSDFRIVGGTAAPAGKYPFYVNTLRPILCGGTLIHDDIVLTAARTFGDDGR